MIWTNPNKFQFQALKKKKKSSTKPIIAIHIKFSTCKIHYTPMLYLQQELITQQIKNKYKKIKGYLKKLPFFSEINITGHSSLCSA